MKKCLLILLGIVWGSLSFLFAEHVPVDKALQVATRFAQQIEDKPLRSGQSLELAYAARPSLRAAAPEAYYYVFNRGNNGGYIIIAGDDRAYPVLGYGTSGDFSYEKIPDNMKWWLQGYADQIQYAYANIPGQDPEVKERWDALLGGQKLSSLRSVRLIPTAKWDQTRPFNNDCPYGTVTGCVATSMAIVMKYYRWPSRGTGSHTNPNGNYFADFNVTYDWNNMLDDYSISYTKAQGEAVAKLMYHCGIACDMKYGKESSATSVDLANALHTYFKYDKSIANIQKSDYSDSEWNAMLKDELDGKNSSTGKPRPVLYRGTGASGGHAFVIDGYNSNNMYHFNWGWSGSYNDYFSLSSLKPGSYNFTIDQAMIINVKPDEGDSPLNQVRVVNRSNHTGGLSVASIPEKGETFTMKVSALSGITSIPFNAYVEVAHIDANGNIKRVITSRNSLMTFEGSYSYYYNIQYNSCKIVDDIATGDKLCLVYRVGSTTATPQIVEGGPNLTSMIELTTGDTPSTSYKVTWNTLSGVTVSPVSGYNANSIAAGGIFKFKITNTTGKAVVVKNGTTTLTPDASGVYTILNIRKNIQLTLSLAAFTYKVTWNTPSGVTVSPVSGYNANSIAAGGTFKFKITAPTGKAVVVKNGTATLTPDASGVYTISNIQKNIQLTLSLTAITYKVTWNTPTGVTVVPESGYNANSVAAGGTFKFKITNTTGKAVVVKNGTATLTPNYAGVYTISNVQGNITLTLSLVVLAEYTVAIPSTVTGVVIKKPTGFTGKVKSGDNFKFSVDPLDGYAAGVKVDGKYLYREYRGTWDGDYTIYDITKNVVIEIEAIRLSQVNTTKTVTTTAGNLEDHITDRECCYLQKLIVKGSVGYMDEVFMRSDLPEITTIDLSEATFSGNALTTYSLCFMSRLKEIILPASITSIQEKAFCYDVSLSRVVMNRSVPPALHADAFYAIPASQLTIVVPSGAGPAYRAAAVWKNYTIVEMAATTYRVTFPVVTGFEVKASAGYNALSVPEGSDFKFTVTPKAGYEAYTVKVTANDVVLTPASGNVYTIRNVTANQTVKVEATPPDTPTTYRILSRADRGATLVPESGYNANAVAAGDDFKFHVSVNAAYREWEVKVEVDGLTLRPDSRGVYTISNIRADKNVIITFTEVYAVTFVKPKEDVKMVAEAGYDADRIVAGYDFKFHLVSRYTEDQLTVAANGVVLRPIGKIYTIYGIRENQEVTVLVHDVSNEKISGDNVRIQVIDHKLCITHPTMKNVPVYVVSFDGTLSTADKLNGVYTELELPGKGAYIVSFEGFSRKIMVK